MLLAIVSGVIGGRVEAVNAALFKGVGEALTLMMTLGSAMCLWSGMMRVADKAGFTRVLSRVLSPILRVLFPGLPPDGEACRAISMNVAANILGLGNAATPLGLKAMAQLQTMNPDKTRASRHMIVFAVLNTASVQLMPTTVAALRLETGSAQPMAILPAVWITSIGSAVAAVAIARLFGGEERRCVRCLGQPI
jgi:spore maturation protein A